MEYTLRGDAIGRAGVRGGLLPKIALSAIVVGLLGPLAVSNTLAAFGSTSGAADNAFAAGTVYLSDSDAGSSMLSMANAGPGSTATSYIVVAYTGTLASTIRLYGLTTGTGLARFLNLTVTRGSGTGAGFVPDPTDYTGAGAGVIYRGTLADLPSDYGTGIVDPGTWQGPESHSYRFQVTVADDGAAQGLTAGADFLWEARNT